MSRFDGATCPGCKAPCGVLRSSYEGRVLDESDRPAPTDHPEIVCVACGHRWEGSTAEVNKAFAGGLRWDRAQRLDTKKAAEDAKRERRLAAYREWMKKGGSVDG